MDAPQERLQYPRVKVKIPVELHLSAGSPQHTSIDEISLCGCYIETMMGYSQGLAWSVDASVKALVTTRVGDDGPTDALGKNLR